MKNKPTLFTFLRVYQLRTGCSPIKLQVINIGSNLKVLSTQGFNLLYWQF